MKKPLTDRQELILSIMVTFHLLNGRWPTLRAIGDSLIPPIRGLNGVWGHLAALEKKGWIRRHMANVKTSVFEVVRP